MIYYLTNSIQTVEKVMKILKKISFSAITLSSLILLSACSSGGSSNSGPLNLTGVWNGEVSWIRAGASSSGSTSVLESSGVYSARLVVSQERPVTIAANSPAEFNLTFTGFDGCVGRLTVEDGVVDGTTNSIRSGGDDETSFTAVVTNTSINGNFDAPAGGGGPCGVVIGAVRFSR